MGFWFKVKYNTFVKSLDMLKKVVGIAMGGYGSERSISIKSGETVFQNLNTGKWDIYRLLIDKNQWTVLDEKNIQIAFNKSKFNFNLNGKNIRFDIIFNAIHGAPGENGDLADILESQKIPQTSCKTNVAKLTFNKRKCLEFAKKIGIATANSIVIEKGDLFDEENIENIVGLPCFIKPNRSGSSYGIAKVYHKEDIKEAVHKAFEEDSQVIIESFLEGTEISVGVYGNNGNVIILPATEIISENDFFDYQAKYEGKSEEITPAKIDIHIVKKVNNISEKLYRKMELSGICRSEFILVKNEPHLLEINTVPGLTGESLIPKQLDAAGINITDFFDQLLEEALKKNN